MRIREERNILPAVICCPRCTERHRSAPPRVSVRALILALGRFEIEEAAAVKEVERRWNTYRKERGLDLYGKSVDRAKQETSPGVPCESDAWREREEYGDTQTDLATLELTGDRGHHPV